MTRIAKWAIGSRNATTVTSTPPATPPLHARTVVAIIALDSAPRRLTVNPTYAFSSLKRGELNAYGCERKSVSTDELPTRRQSLHTGRSGPRELQP